MEPLTLCSDDSKKITRDCRDTWGPAISMLKTGYEEECLQLINLVDQVRLNWKKAEAEKIVYLDKCRSLERKEKDLEEENAALNDRLVNCQAEIQSIITKKKDVELKLAEYKKRFDDVQGIFRDPTREIQHLTYMTKMQSPEKSPYRAAGVAPSLDNTTTASGNILEPFHVTPRRNVFSSIYDEQNENDVDFSATSNSDIDYDRTNESLDTSSDTPGIRRMSRKRRSRSQNPATRTIKFEDDEKSLPKRSKVDSQEFVATATITVDPTGAKEPSGTLSIRRSMNRSMSESTLNGVGGGYSRIQTLPANPANSLRSPAAIASSWTNGQPIARRTHRVANFRPIFEYCDVCNKRFGLTNSNALRCVDCLVKFHRSCHKAAPMPCVPYVEVPKLSKNQKLPLKIYCPQSHPMIPRLLIHCIVALEADRLPFEGIYRIPGPDPAVIKLYNEMLTCRVIPNLTNVQTETITSVIKRFLRDLKDSLIPTASFEDFKAAVDSNSNEQLEKAVFDLPNANRDTLAYFLVHLFNVAKFSTENRMPLENLARVLAPTVVGYSSFVTTTNANQDMITKTQYAVLYRLLKMPQEFWIQFIEKNMSAVIYSEKTPNIRKDFLTPQASRVGSRKMHTYANTPRPPMDMSPLIQPLNVSTRQGAFFNKNLL